MNLGYKIVQSTTVKGLQTNVRKAIKKGWQPLGGFTTNGSSGYQAMIKHEQENKRDE